MTRSAVVHLIDRIRDHLLIAKTALQEDEGGVDKAASAIESAADETRALVEELRR